MTEIAARNNIPKKFTDTILLELRNSGILRSKKGPNGGYSLSKMPSEIMIGQVIRTLDGPRPPSAVQAAQLLKPVTTVMIRRPVRSGFR